MEHRVADTIFVGGSILTQAAHPTDRVTAVAVRDGVIIAAGGDDVLDLRVSTTEIVHLGAGALMPGFIDSHIHPVMGGLARSQCDLSEVHSIEDYRRLISAYASRHGGQWIEGYGWYGDMFAGGFPTKEILDGIVSDRPAAFKSHDAHSLWVNSRALEIAGIDRDTPDPEGGRISRDAAGHPSGQLMESAMGLLAPHRPTVGDAQFREALLQAQSYLNSLGVTSWQDALVGAIFGLDDFFPAYLAAFEDRALHSRVTGALIWPPGADPKDLSDVLHRRSLTGGRFNATAIKFVLDGNCENLTAAVHEAYVGHPHEFGMMQYGEEELQLVSRALSDAGFDLHMHAVGDLAVGRAIDAIGAIADRVDRRHQIAHIDLIDDDDVARMREVGIIANVTPLWARLDPVLVETKLPLLTPRQQERHFAYGTLHGAEIEIAFGSDWPVSTPDPIANIHTAVNRTAAPDDPHASDVRSRTEPLLPHERLSLQVSLDAYTRTAAKAARQDEWVGTIEVGKEADLVVLDRDPRSVEASELGELRVTQTFVHGERVYS